MVFGEGVNLRTTDRDNTWWQNYLISSEMSLVWTDVNVSNRFSSNETRHSSNVSSSYTDVTFTAQVNCKRALSDRDTAHSFAQVCWRHHNAALSHSKCFWMGICSLSHKMESRGGLGIWKGHIWGPPLWVFTFKDKWSHWVPASCEWAPSAYTGFLNAHQNNLSKPRDAFLRRLMWGQIGNHFNKIPLGWNCISQKSRALARVGWNSGNTNGWRFTWSF